MKWKSSLIDNFGRYRILVVGDIMLDRYIWGHVHRISPEAPVPVLNLAKSESRVGGAANVALNFHNLGASVQLCGMIGDDAAGRLFLDLAHQSGIGTDGILASPEKPTTTKTRVIAGSQHLLRIDEEQAGTYATNTEQELVERVRGLASSGEVDAIVIQDYNKGVLSESSIPVILDIADKNSTPVMVDPKYDNFYAYRGVAIMKPNLSEMLAALPFHIGSAVTELNKASRHIRDQLNNELTCITLSDKGIYIEDAEGSKLYHTRPREVVDVCGAGDAVIGVLTLGYLSGLERDQLAAVANSAGGIVCEHVGVTPVSADMLKKDLAARR